MPPLEKSKDFTGSKVASKIWKTVRKYASFSWFIKFVVGFVLKNYKILIRSLQFSINSLTEKENILFNI